MSTDTLELVSVEHLAEFLNLTARRVQQLASDGVIPRTDRGAYELAPAVRAYVRYLQGIAGGKGTEAEDLQRERTALARVQREEIELRILEKRRTLIPATEIEPAWLALVAAARAHLRAEPDRLAHILDTLEGVAPKRDVLAESFDAFLGKLSGFEPTGEHELELGVGAPGGGAPD